MHLATQVLSLQLVYKHATETKETNISKRNIKLTYRYVT